jgi:uncharacterized protein
MATRLEPFTGEERFAAPPARVFEALTDPDSLAAAIPDLVSHEKVDDRTLKCSVRPGFSFIRTTLRMTVEIAEAQPHEQVSLRIHSQGIGAAMKVECRMRIHPEQGGAAAQVAWEAHVHELSGLITAVSPTLIRGAADKVIRDGWETLRRRIEQP